MATKPRTAKTVAKTGRARPKTARVTFVCDIAPDAESVFLAGDFNGWHAECDAMQRKNGCFRKTKQLAPGEYEYKFVVDGEWFPDPNALAQTINEFGSMNSVVRV